MKCYNLYSQFIAQPHRFVVVFDRIWGCVTTKKSMMNLEQEIIGCDWTNSCRFCIENYLVWKSTLFAELLFDSRRVSSSSATLSSVYFHSIVFDDNFINFLHIFLLQSVTKKTKKTVLILSHTINSTLQSTNQTIMNAKCVILSHFAKQNQHHSYDYHKN